MYLSLPQSYPPSYPPDSELLPRKTVLYLDPDNASVMTVIDNSMNYNKCTLSGVTLVSKPVGKAFNLNGSNAYGVFTSNQLLDITSAPLTIAAWIKPSSQTGYIFVKNTSSAANVQYAISYDTANKFFYTYLEGATRANSAINSVLNDLWYFVCAVWDGTSVKTYVNGVPNGTGGSYSGSLTSRTYTRLGRRETAAAYFKGLLGELWLTRSALTKSEVKNLYENTAHKYGLKI